MKNWRPGLNDRTAYVHANTAVSEGTLGVFLEANSRREVTTAGLGVAADCVILEDGEIGDRIQVALPGQEVNVLSGSVLAAFAQTMSDASGKLVPHGAVVGQYFLGKCQEAAAGADEIVSFMFGTPHAKEV